MQIANSQDDLGSVKPSHSFIEPSLFIEKIEELAALDKSHDEEYFLLVLEYVIHRY